MEAMFLGISKGSKQRLAPVEDQGDFAHADMAAHIAAQQTFRAPSLLLNQHRTLRSFLPETSRQAASRTRE